MKTYLDPEEVKLMEEAATCVRDRLLIRILFHLGCRISEALGLSIDDIDLQHGTVTIEHLKKRISLSCPDCKTRLGKNHRYCPGCSRNVERAIAQEKEHRRVRTLPLDNDTLVMLNDYITRGGPVVRGGKRLIFGINRHRGWQIVRDCARRAGLGDLVNQETGRIHHISPHRLRDGFAIVAVKHNDSGDGLRLLQEFLGHQNISTTMRYRKISGEELNQWYNGLWNGQTNNEGDE